MTQPSWNLPDAVLFDMDGTLLDSEHLHWESALEIIAEHRQREAPVPLIQDWIGWNESAFWDAMREDFGFGLCNQELTDLRSAIFERMFVEEGPRWMTGALPLLKMLSNAVLPMAVVTAAPRQQLDLVAEHADFARWFQTWLSGENDTERSKPHPDPYLEAASRLGVAPERCLAIEDSPTGAESARAAGCYTIAIPSLPLPAERFRVAHKLMFDLRELHQWLLDRATHSDHTQRAVLPR